MIISTKHAILGLLYDKPRHGYDIKREFEHIVSNIWSINYGQLYPILKKLEQEKLIERKNVSQENKPDKIVYYITEMGRKEVQQWLMTPVAKRQMKDEFYLKMLFMGNADRGKALDFIDAQIEVTQKQYQQIKDYLNQAGDWIDSPAGMLAQAGLMHGETDLKWLKLCKEKILSGKYRGNCC